MNLKSWHIAFGGIVFQIILAFMLLFLGIGSGGLGGLLSGVIGAYFFVISLLGFIPLAFLYFKKVKTGGILSIIFGVIEIILQGYILGICLLIAGIFALKKGV